MCVEILGHLNLSSTKRLFKLFVGIRTLVICDEGFRHKQQQSGFQSWTKPSKKKIIQNTMFILGLISKTPQLPVLIFLQTSHEKTMTLIVLNTQNLT